MFRQATLFGDAPPAVSHDLAGLRRVRLDPTTWIDHAESWVAGADRLFDELVARVTWRQKEVLMWGRPVLEPRLSSWWRLGDGLEALPILGEMRTTLSTRYDVEFDSIGFNLYRHGQDSVAWHADRRGPQVPDPTIAIVSVGTRRALRLRPKGGGEGVSYFLGDGDLFVMGGACQDDWEHGVPKSKHVAGPRMSITFRHSGVH